jgi:hypothetical protein
MIHVAAYQQYGVSQTGKGHGGFTTGMARAHDNAVKKIPGQSESAPFGGPLGGFEGVDLGGGFGVNLHMSGKVAAAVSPFAFRRRIAGAELFRFKFAHTIAAFTLIDNRRQNKTVYSHTFEGAGSIV